MQYKKPPKGTRDIVYEEAAVRRIVIGRLRDQFLQFGFGDMDTPAFEHLETLRRKSGPEVEGQIYSFQDKAQRELGLVFEFTASLGRVAATNQALLRPYKRYQINKVWRYESPQSNRFREFYQADVDIVGPYTMDCEVEIISLVAHVLHHFSLDDFVVILNNRKVLLGQLAIAGIGDDDQQVMLRGLDKIDKIGVDGVRDYVTAGGVATEDFERFMTLMPAGETNEAMLADLQDKVASNEIGHQGVAELTQILSLAVDCGLGDRIRLTPFLVRGLDYYTGPIFEVRSESLGNTSFGGGGRYDTLVETFGGVPCGAIGFSFGVERLIAVLSGQGLVVADKSTAQVMIARHGDVRPSSALRLAGELRAKGLSVFQYVGDASLSKQLKFASKMGFPYVVPIGEAELQSQTFRVKNMATGEEQEVARAQLAAQLLSVCDGEVDGSVPGKPKP